MVEAEGLESISQPQAVEMGGQNSAVNRNDDDGWVHLQNEDDHHQWIRQFDKPVGYREHKVLRNAKPTDFLFLVLNDFGDPIKQMPTSSKTVNN